MTYNVTLDLMFAGNLFTFISSLLVVLFSLYSIYCFIVLGRKDGFFLGLFAFVASGIVTTTAAFNMLGY